MVSRYLTWLNQSTLYFITHMNQTQWLILAGVVFGFGLLLLKGSGSRSNR